MAHRGVCPDMACQLVEMEIPKQKSKHQACKVVAEKLGLPLATIRTMVLRNTSLVDSDESKKNKSSEETSPISNLHTLTLDSRKIVFGLRETNGNRFLVMQEFREGRKGREIPTKNHFTIPVDLIPQFRSALDQGEALIQERCSGESGADGPDHKEDDEVETPVGDDGGADGGASQTNLVNPNEEDADLSPPPVDDTGEATVGSELVQCVDCVHFAVKKWAPEENGACNSRSRSWNGVVFQEPNEPHHCLSFQMGELS